MSNGIGRKRTMGIAGQASYSVPAVSPTFTLSLLDTPKITPVQNKVLNNAAMGSTYAENAAKKTTRQSTIGISFKVDENSLPLVLSQKFTIETVTAPGETEVYIHTLTYNSTNLGTAFTLFLQDSDRTSQTSEGVMFGNANLTIDQGFVRCDMEGIGKSPETWTNTNTIVAPNEFVGRNAAFSYGDYGSSTASNTILMANLNHNFPLSGDDTNFNLGDEDLGQLYTLEDSFEVVVSALFSSLTGFRSDYVDDTAKQAIFTLIDTDRYVSGSVANTRPKIVFNYPYAKVTGWEEQGGLGDVLKQQATLKPLDYVGVATAPLTITITNAVASY